MVKITNQLTSTARNQLYELCVTLLR